MSLLILLFLIKDIQYPASTSGDVHSQLLIADEEKVPGLHDRSILPAGSFFPRAQLKII